MENTEKQYYKLFKDFAEIINSSLNVTEVLPEFCAKSAVASPL